MSAPAHAFAVSSRVKGLCLADEPTFPADPPNLYRIDGDGAWAMFDSGWGRPRDLEAMVAWLEAEPPAGRPTHLVFSHAHRDHVGGSALLATRYGLRPAALAEERDTALRHVPGLTFETLAPDARVDLGGGVVLTVVPTPGHTAGSLSLRVEAPGEAAVLCTGDTLVGRHSSWIGPPDGDLDAYLATLARLADPAGPEAACRLAPGHGPAGARVGNAAAAMRARRLAREEDIAALLAEHPTARALVARLYGGGEGLILGPGGMAERTVLAHLDRLVRAGRATACTAAGHADPFTRIYRPRRAASGEGLATP